MTTRSADIGLRAAAVVAKEQMDEAYLNAPSVPDSFNQARKDLRLALATGRGLEGAARVAKQEMDAADFEVDDIREWDDARARLGAALRGAASPTIGDVVYTVMQRPRDGQRRTSWGVVRERDDHGPTVDILWMSEEGGSVTYLPSDNRAELRSHWIRADQPNPSGVEPTGRDALRAFDLTKEEWIRAVQQWKNFPQASDMRQLADMRAKGDMAALEEAAALEHTRAVLEAVRDGRPVSAAVLAPYERDYPSLLRLNRPSPAGGASGVISGLEDSLAGAPKESSMAHAEEYEIVRGNEPTGKTVRLEPSQMPSVLRTLQEGDPEYKEYALRPVKGSAPTAATTAPAAIPAEMKAGPGEERVVASVYNEAGELQRRMTVKPDVALKIPVGPGEHVTATAKTADGENVDQKRGVRGSRLKLAVTEGQIKGLHRSGKLMETVADKLEAFRASEKRFLEERRGGAIERKRKVRLD